MPIQIPPKFPWRPDIIDNLHHLDPLTWSIAGRAVDDCDRGIAGVAIKFIDKQTNAEISHTVTDENGRFSAKVVTNSAGYRVKPYLYMWAFCPGYFDVAGNSDLPYFRGHYIAKEPAK